MQKSLYLELLPSIFISTSFYSCNPTNVVPEPIVKTLSGNYQYSSIWSTSVKGEVYTDTGLMVIDIHTDSPVITTIEYMVDSAVLTIPDFKISEKLVYVGDGLYKYDTLLYFCIHSI